MTRTNGMAAGFAALAITAFAGSASAEEIVLVSGAKYEATSIEIADPGVRFTYVADGRSITMTVPEGWVKPDSLYGILQPRTKANDAKGLLRLAKIALAQGWRQAAEIRFRKAAALDATLAPECEAALAAAKPEPVAAPLPVEPPPVVPPPAPAAPLPPARIPPPAVGGTGGIPAAASFPDPLEEALARAREEAEALGRQAAAARDDLLLELERLRRDVARLSNELAQSRLRRRPLSEPACDQPRTSSPVVRWPTTVSLPRTPRPNPTPWVAGTAPSPIAGGVPVSRPAPASGPVPAAPTPFFPPIEYGWPNGTGPK